uniref:C2H2-type domain-containing protein n=1 Tax=Panagrolaimus davidi TaxID=227884 RepID=A0A914PJC3_9BILA
MPKIKKEVAEPSVVTIDSDSENESIQVFKGDDPPYDVPIYNNKIMIVDLVALFPNFHGLHLSGNGINRMLSKIKYEKKGYFPPPKEGWAGVKVVVLIVEPTAAAKLESTNSTPRSTPISNDAAIENIKPVKEPDIPSRPVTPIHISDEQIFDRFNVSNMTQLCALPQFQHNSFFDPEPFVTYRSKFIEIYRASLMALGPESFNLSFIFQLNRRSVDTSRLLPALEGQKAFECENCQIAFSEPTSAFQHYCSISHGEKLLAEKNLYAMEIVDILKVAKERLMFPPPIQRPQIRPLMASPVPPPVRLCNDGRQTRWDVQPTSYQLLRPAIPLPRLIIPFHLRTVSPGLPVNSNIIVQNNQIAPMLPERESQQKNQDSGNNNDIVAAKTMKTNLIPQSSTVAPPTKKEQIQPDKKAPTKSQPSSSRPLKKTSRVVADIIQTFVAKNVDKTKKKSQNAPVVVQSAGEESESSDFEHVRHVNRPIKGEFGEATINRTPQIPEKELLFHYKVKSLTELAKLRPMLVPHLISDMDGFYKFRAFAFTNLRNILVKASKVGRLMYVLFMASKADVSFQQLDKNAKRKCSTCKEEFTLKHILSKKHILLYRDKYFCDPEEILVMLEPKNQKFYIGDDERPMVLQNFNVHSFEALKTKPQFCKNRLYDNSYFIALKDCFIDRLKLTNLRIDPRFFSLEKILWLKSLAKGNEELLPLLHEIFVGFARKCDACGVQISTWQKYVKHIVSKPHIRNELTQAQMNLIIKAMRLIKETENGYEISPQAQRSRNLSLRQFTDSSDGESSDDEPPDDPVSRKANDAAERFNELKERLRKLSNYKKPTSNQILEIEQIKNELG